MIHHNKKTVPKRVEKFIFIPTCYGNCSYTSLKFKNRLQLYILGKHVSQAISARANTESDVSKPFVNLEDCFQNEDDKLTKESDLFQRKLCEPG